jgi:hypothetical protein
MVTGAVQTMARQAATNQQGAASMPATAGSGTTAQASAEPFPATSTARGRRTDIFLTQRSGTGSPSDGTPTGPIDVQPVQQQAVTWEAQAPDSSKTATIELKDLVGNVTALMNSTFADVGQRIGMAIANSTSLSLVEVGSAGNERLNIGSSTVPQAGTASEGAPASHTRDTALDRGVSHFGNLLNEAISQSTGLPSLPMTG